jgi:hypothetical protein
MRSFVICNSHQILFRLPIKRIRWARHVARMRKRREAHRISVGKLNDR